MFCMLKMKKYIMPLFQNKTQCVKNKLFFQWFQTEKDGIAESIFRKIVGWTAISKGHLQKAAFWIYQAFARMLNFNTADIQIKIPFLLALLCELSKH